MSSYQPDKKHLVEIKHATIDYQLKQYDIRAVTNLSLSLVKGKITALVGESGSGKTTLASALLQTIASPGKMVDGEIHYQKTDQTWLRVDQISNKHINQFRWEQVSMVFQAAQSALNPVMTIFEQYHETLLSHRSTCTTEEAKQRSVELLQYVKLDPERILKSYPHELSGGMKQRVMIAFSMIMNPQLIILDEPTTALDVITQDYIFKLLKEINREQGITMLLLTHDIGVVSRYADYVGVMYAGRLMEYGSVYEVFGRPKHPYTAGLIQATPSLKGDMKQMKPIPGAPPDLRQLPPGCKFAPRCEKAMPQCHIKEPETEHVQGTDVKCFLYRP